MNWPVSFVDMGYLFAEMKPVNLQTSQYLRKSTFVETGSHYVAYTDFKLYILPSQPPEYWDCRCVPPYQAIEESCLLDFI
jgi:hypothetical protein